MTELGRHMRSTRELRDTRDLIAARQRLAAEAERVQTQLLLEVDEGREVRRGIWRCDQAHARRGAPKLAETYAVNERTVLVVTKIAWLPSDQLNLRPWAREHLLGAGSSSMDDDRTLSRWLDQLDAWEAGRPSDGPRWLQRQDPTVIVTLIGVNAEPTITAWCRCKDHPEAVESIDRHAAWDSMR